MENIKAENILNAATILFAEKGYAEVSVREIIQAANAKSIAEISRRFGGKRELYLAVLREHFKNVHNLAENISAAGKTPVEKLEKIFAAIGETYRNSPYTVKLLANEINHPSEFFPEIEAELRSVQKFAGEIIREGVEAGIFRADLDVRGMVLAMYGAAHFAFLMPNFTRELTAEDLDARLAEVQKIFFRGIMR